MESKKGCLIYNGFWNPSAPPDPVLRLAKAAEERGVHMESVPNTQLTADLGDGVSIRGVRMGFAFFWDKDIRLARALESAGVRLYNRADAIEVCDDKAATHLRLAAARLPMPRTLIAPMTYREINDQVEPFCQRAEETLGYPMVMKECYGSFGGQVFLVHGGEELRRLARERESRPFLVQELISCSVGEDYRLYMVGGRCAAAMRRYSDNDFRANIGNGGMGEGYTPSREEVRLAAACCRLLGLDFAGVDLLHGPDGQPLVCEVNSNAFMAGITACTGIDVAGVLTDYVLKKEGLIR